jgi:hypothetical protein
MSLKTVWQLVPYCPAEKLKIAFEQYRDREKTRAGGILPFDSVARAQGLTIKPEPQYTDIRLARKLIEADPEANGRAVARKIAVHNPQKGGLQDKWLIGVKLPDYGT